MQVPVFKLCRHAAQIVDGTMMLTSIVRVVRPSAYPAPFPPLKLAIEIEWDPVDPAVELTTRLIDDDGALVWQAPLLAETHPSPTGATVSDWLILDMWGTCHVPRPGDYRLELFDGVQIVNETRIRFAG